MIKQSFLDALKGLGINAAKVKVVAEGHKVYVVPEGSMAITLIARPNTVVIWQEDGKVSSAEAGDGLELDQDI